MKNEGDKKNNRNSNFTLVLRDIIEKNGKEVFFNRKGVALVKDIAPERSNEIKLLQIAVENGIVKFIDDGVERDGYSWDTVRKSAVRRLSDVACLDPKKADRIVGSIGEALGYVELNEGSSEKKFREKNKVITQNNGTKKGPVNPQKIEKNSSTDDPRRPNRVLRITVLIATVLFLVVGGLVVNSSLNEVEKNDGADRNTQGTQSDYEENQRNVSEISIENEKPVTHEGTFSMKVDEEGYEDFNTDSYSIETNESGVYGVTASDLHNDASMYIDIYDSVGSEMDLGMGTHSIDNEVGIFFRAEEVGDVEARVGEKYSIDVKGNENTPYRLYLWKPKEVVKLTDINSSDYLIHDIMQFPGQENRYSIVVNETGTFVFKLDDLTDDSYIEMRVYTRNKADERYREELEKVYYSGDTEDELSMELKEGEEYFVHVLNSTSYDKVGEYPYTLNVKKMTED